MALQAKTIQKGTIVLGAGVTTNTATISSVTTGNTVVIPTGVTGDLAATNAERFLVSLQLTNGTTVTATRGEGTDDAVTVSYAVVEFVSATVQRGLITVADEAASATATVSAVTEAQTIVISSIRTTISGAKMGSLDEAMAVELTNTTTITAIRQGTSGGDLLIEYQLVEFDGSSDAVCQNGVTAVAGTSTTQAINAVVLNRTFLFYTFSVNATADGTSDRSMSYGYFSTTTELTFIRNTSPGGLSVAWFVCELSAANVVQEIVVSMANADGDDDDTIGSAVTVANATAHLANGGRFGTWDQSDNMADGCSCITAVTGVTTLNTVRGDTSGVMVGRVYVIDWDVQSASALPLIRRRRDLAAFEGMTA